MADLPAGTATSTTRKTREFMVLMLMMPRRNQNVGTPDLLTLYTLDIKQIKQTYVHCKLVRTTLCKVIVVNANSHNDIQCMSLIKVGDNSMIMAATEALQNTSVGPISARTVMSSAIN